jgi:hypothetical protein
MAIASLLHFPPSVRKKRHAYLMHITSNSGTTRSWWSLHMWDGRGVNEVWLLEESGFCRRPCRDHVKMENHYYFVGGDRPLVELCLTSGVRGCRCVAAANNHQWDITTVVHKSRRQDFVRRIQFATKTSDRYMKFRLASWRFFSKS